MRSNRLVRSKGTRTAVMVRTITAYFGSRIGTAYAEPFFTHEMLGFAGLDQLV